MCCLSLSVACVCLLEMQSQVHHSTQPRARVFLHAREWACRVVCARERETRPMPRLRGPKHTREHLSRTRFWAPSKSWWKPAQNKDCESRVAQPLFVMTGRENHTRDPLSNTLKSSVPTRRQRMSTSTACVMLVSILCASAVSLLVSFCSLLRVTSGSGEGGLWVDVAWQEVVHWAASPASPLCPRSRKWMQEVLEARPPAGPDSKLPFSNGKQLPACMQVTPLPLPLHHHNRPSCACTCGRDDTCGIILSPLLAIHCQERVNLVPPDRLVVK